MDGWVCGIDRDARWAHPWNQDPWGIRDLLNEGLSAAAAALASAGIQHRRNAGVGRVLPTPSPAGPAGQETTQQNHTITLCIADTGA